MALKWAELHDLNSQLTRGPPLVAQKASSGGPFCLLETTMELDGSSLSEFGRNKDNNTDPGLAEICAPPAWLSTYELEDELQAAMCQAGKEDEMHPALDVIDAYFADDAEETPTQYRRSLLRLLSFLRPQLADLLGWPATR
jgi:hypothetical protein